MKRNIYIDESGNTGDIIRKDLTFANQPLFSLAAVELKKENEMNSFISDLHKKYRIQSSELKAKTIYKSNPELILELCEFIANEDIPYFIELIDKKFNICTAIVNHHILPPYFTGDESNGQVQFLRNIIASYMSQHMPDEYYFDFFEACTFSTEDSLLKSMNSLQSYFFQIKDNFDMKNVSQFVEESIDDYHSLKKLKDNDADVLKMFLPIPDLNKKQSKIWLLPHVSCFSNIIARVNLHVQSGMKDVTFIHDKQDHFDEILENIKIQMTDVEFSEEMVDMLFSNFSLDGEPSLKFSDSQDSVGIQVSDLLAGFVTRYYYEHLYLRKKTNDVYHKIREVLLKSADFTRGLGMNMVLPDSILENDSVVYNRGFKLEMR